MGNNIEHANRIEQNHSILCRDEIVRIDYKFGRFFDEGNLLSDKREHI